MRVIAKCTFKGKVFEGYLRLYKSLPLDVITSGKFEEICNWSSEKMKKIIFIEQEPSLKLARQPGSIHLFKVNNKNTRTRCETSIASFWCLYC